MMFTVVYALFGSAIFNVMTTQTEVQNAATTWLWWVALTPLIGVWSFLLDGIFIGTTHTREMRNGMIISTALFLSASLVLVPLLGNHGLWSSYCILMLARAATLGWWYPRLLILKN
jgi:MATE family multidrug resistance protein